MKYSIKVFFLFVSLIQTLSCLAQNNFGAGSICSIEKGEGRFGVIKVLVVEDSIFHLKIYKNTFEKRSSKIDLKKLTVGSIFEEDGGMAHAAVSKLRFFAWKPIEVTVERVRKRELEGYEIWKEVKGGSNRFWIRQ